MTLSIKVTSKISKSKTPSLVVVFADKEGNVLGDIDASYHEHAKALINKSGFEGGLGESVNDFGDTPLVVVGVGKLDKLANNIAKVAKHTYHAIKNQKSAIILWGNTICHKHFGQFVVALGEANYRFDTYKKEANKPNLNQITLVNNKDEATAYDEALVFAKAVINAQTLARNVANEPPNVCTPSYMAQQAKDLADEFADVLQVQVLDEKKMQKLGMGAFLAVSQGSEQEGKIAIIEYFGKTQKTAKAKLSSPIALVGKGVTFDTGGISIKPSAGMDEMKFDMGGAAAMLGLARGLCEANLPIDVVIVLACAENMPSGNASRPGDVVYAMDGTSIEILNTDAEGRLVLADALCYAQKHYKPSLVIDSATLTGACVVALGAHRSGLYSNDEDVLFDLENASKDSGDLVWHMPLGDDYASQLKSSVADLQNIGGPKGGSVTAACFLQHFVKDTPWAHLDIAGTAWIGGDNKTATGRPVPLLMHYLKNKTTTSHSLVIPDQIIG